eukprot:3070091-Rhodomonas_salina.2
MDAAHCCTLHMMHIVHIVHCTLHTAHSIAEGAGLPRTLELPLLPACARAQQHTAPRTLDQRSASHRTAAHAGHRRISQCVAPHGCGALPARHRIEPMHSTVRLGTEPGVARQLPSRAARSQCIEAFAQLHCYRSAAYGGQRTASA